MQSLFAEPKDIRRDLNHWKNIADTVAKKYPQYNFAIVEDMHGSYVCTPITAKFNREIIYKTKENGHHDS